ncbi:MAG TPA: ATP-binding protein, partial [Puia sp.]
AVVHPGDNRFTFYNQDNSRLPIDKVHALLCDSRGRMWVGTYGGGLSVFDKANGKFINYSEKDGLANTTIYQIVEDAEERIWVSTNTGVSCFDPEAKVFRNFSGLNGLQNSNFVHGSGLRLADGEILFGGLQGFNYFDPSRLTVNRNVPAVVLTDLQIANKSVLPGKSSPIRAQVSVADEIRLDYKQNFALSFVALNYTLPKQNQYAYRLDGFDKEWNYTGAMNTARYTNLDPGEYLFRVKAGNNDGVWSTEERSIRIFVRPPFWRTVYAYSFYILAAGGLLWYSRYRGVSRMRRKFRLERERAEVRRMRELDQMKLKFLTNLSHEFRTPIALIMGPVEELLSDQQEKESRNKLFMIRRNARRLLNLVNQLLDFRKMEEQELRLRLSEGELVTFMKDVVYSFADLSGRKHIQLDFVCALPRLYVLFDPDKLERILFNLLSNAFKFTLEGGRIAVVLDVADESGNKWVSIVVTDTGVGIPAAQLPLIFDRFFQHAAEVAVLNQGTGIGLSITREFVQLHGGTISVESEEGQGSAFTVLLPLRLVEEQGVSGGASDGVASEGDVGGQEVEPVAGERPRVLLVEDNDDFRSYLRDSLEAYYHIMEASDGKEGWQKALAGHPQLIVSDISMPRMGGIELSKKLKADKRTCHIPIILLTALAGDAQQVQGLETGANDYITKPFNFEVLHTKIRNLLELRRNLKTTYTRQIQVLQPEVEMQTEDERLLQAIVRCLEEHIGDPQLSVEFLSREVGMSRSSLYSKVLELTGETPVEYIRSFKLGRAAMLLEKSDVTIAEAAYQTGFSKPNYFARVFKAKYDMLPSEYVAQKRKRGE